jgi:hypothetical protein
MIPVVIYDQLGREYTRIEMISDSAGILKETLTFDKSLSKWCLCYSGRGVLHTCQTTRGVEWSSA